MDAPTWWTQLLAFVATFFFLVLLQRSMEPEGEYCNEAGDGGLEPNSNNGFVPSHYVAQLFPSVGVERVASLLEDAGVRHPHSRIFLLDENTQGSIQRVVDELVLVHGADSDNSTEPELLCTICCEEFLVSQMVSCKGNDHLFCRACVRQYAETQVFGSGQLGEKSSTELTCMTEGCLSVFPHSILKQVLPEMVLERYGELQSSLNLAKANLKDLCSCPRCQFKAELPQQETVFRCPECQLASCRHCGEPSHDGKCSDSKEERARLKTEEEMTAIFLRMCPNPVCGKKITKDGGCNKLRCPCGWLMCNVCRKAIDGYSHFCQTPNCNHSTCGKCSLWESTAKEDDRAIQDAFRRGQEEIQNNGVVPAPLDVKAARKKRVLNFFRR